MSVNRKLARLTLEQARVLLASEEEGTVLWAAANSIISLYATISLYERDAENEADTKDHDSRVAMAEAIVDESDVRKQEEIDLFLKRLRYMVQS